MSNHQKKQQQRRKARIERRAKAQSRASVFKQHAAKNQERIRRDMTTPQAPVCDFCSDPNPTRDYEAEEICSAALKPDSSLVLPHVYSPIWASCETCGGFIDRRDQVGLSEHSFEGFPSVRDDIAPSRVRVALMEFMTVLHKAFFATLKPGWKPINPASLAPAIRSQVRRLDGVDSLPDGFHRLKSFQHGDEDE